MFDLQKYLTLGSSKDSASVEYIASPLASIKIGQAFFLTKDRPSMKVLSWQIYWQLCKNSLGPTMTNVGLCNILIIWA